MKRQVVRLFQKYVLNPPAKAALMLGLVPTHAIIETIGRTTGKPRRNPVGNGLAPDGRTFWIVAEHGREAGYVKNITANPRVRVHIGRHWRAGTAELLPDDDPHERLRSIGRAVNGAMVKMAGTHLLTVRVDLDAG